MRGSASPLLLAAFVFVVATVCGSSKEARGVMVGSFSTALLCFIAWMSVETSGARSWLVGGIGEGWTSDELRKLGPEWIVIESISLGGSDIDHVAVGPAGVFVIDSKFVASPYRSRGRSVSTSEMQCAQAAAKQASRVHFMTKSVCEQAWVSAAVVEWGPGVPEGSDARVVAGVEFVAGRAISAWRQTLADAPRRVTPERVVVIAEKLEKQKRTTASL